MILYTLSGLSRDPFSSTYDEELYAELPQRKDALETALDALMAGKGVFIEGPEGSGREWFSGRVLLEAARRGKTVLSARGEFPPDTRALLSSLLLHASTENVRVEVPQLAEKLYTKLLRKFWQNGPVVISPASRPLCGGEALEEVRHLGSARIKGAPLALFVIAGNGPSPLQFLQTIALEPFTFAEKEKILRHRLRVCGNGLALEDSAIQWACRGAESLADSIALARIALCRAAFEKGPPASAAKEQKDSPAPLFSEEQVSEVSRLLASISLPKS